MILSCHLPGGTEKNHKDLSVQLMTQPRCKLRICQIPIQSIITSPAHLGFGLTRYTAVFRLEMFTVQSRTHKTGEVLGYQILDYQTVPVLTLLLTCDFCYCFYTWAGKLIRGVFLLDITFSSWLSAIRVPVFPVFSSVSTSDAEGPEYYGSGYIMKGNVDTLFEAFFNICDYFPHFSSNRISRVSATGLKEL